MYRFALQTRGFVGLLCVLAKGVRHEQPIVPGMKPRAAEVVRVWHHCDPDFLSVQHTAVRTPIGLFAPDLFAVLSAFAVGDRPALFDGERRGNPHTQSHFFLIAKRKIASIGMKRGTPLDQIAVLPNRNLDSTSFRANRLSIRLVGVLNGEQASVWSGFWVFDESLMPNSLLVPPEIRAIHVAEPQPQTGVHRRVVIEVFPLHWRMCASHLEAGECLQVPEIRSQNLIVRENILGNRLVTNYDPERSVALLE
jgi:hypothetical protein